MRIVPQITIQHNFESVGHNPLKKQKLIQSLLVSLVSYPPRHTFPRTRKDTRHRFWDKRVTNNGQYTLHSKIDQKVFMCYMKLLDMRQQCTSSHAHTTKPLHQLCRFPSCPSQALPICHNEKPHNSIVQMCSTSLGSPIQTYYPYSVCRACSTICSQNSPRGAANQHKKPIGTSAQYSMHRGGKVRNMP